MRFLVLKINGDGAPNLPVYNDSMQGGTEIPKLLPYGVDKVENVHFRTPSNTSESSETIAHNYVSLHNPSSI